MSEHNRKATSHNTNDEIDLVEVSKIIWKAKRSVLRITVIFMVIGLFIAIFSPKEYTASTVFVTQDSESKLGGSLGGLAAMAGINLSGMTTGSDISPTLYPNILENIDFKLELLQTPLTFEGIKDSVSFENYYRNFSETDVLSTIRKYSIGLPGQLIKWIKGKPKEIVQGENYTGPIAINLEQFELLKQLSNQIVLEVNENDGYITIEGTMPEALAAAQMVKKTQELLQEYIIEFKIQKATEQLEYINERYQTVEKKFIDIQLKLAKFEDKNKFVNTAMSKIELQTIQDEYDLIYSVYMELAKQLEAQYLQVTEDTPVFTILQPVSVPFKKSAPKRVLILVVWTFFGGVIGSSRALFRNKNRS